MTVGSGELLERDLLRASTFRWKAIAFTSLILAFLVIGVMNSTNEWIGIKQPQIARLEIHGVVQRSDSLKNVLKSLIKDTSVKAVIVSIDSPGGGASDSEEIYHYIRDLSKVKPTVALVEGMAASGGYIVALGADHIIAQHSSIIGSIGVIAQSPNFKKILDNMGIYIDEIKSSPLKAAPSMFSAKDSAGRAVIQQVIDDVFDWFKNLVKERRKMTANNLTAVSDGRVFSTKQALELRLIDKIGREKDAIAWLKTQGIDDTISVETRYPVDKNFLKFLKSIFSLMTSSRLQEKMYLLVEEKIQKPLL